MPSYAVFFELEHEGCWTYATRSRDLVVRTVRQSFPPEAPAVYRADKIVVGSDLKDLKGLLKGFGDILDLRLHVFSKDSGMLSYTRLRDNTISDLANRRGGILLGLEIVDGLERWWILFTRIRREELEGLKGLLESRGNLLAFRWARPDPELVIGSPFLSRREEEALAQALLGGFFDVPRAARAQDIARYMGISASTFLYHLRRAEKKLVRNHVRRSLGLLAGTGRPRGGPGG